jgi:dTMP kinase
VAVGEVLVLDDFAEPGDWMQGRALPVNDADAAGLAEVRYGAGKGHRGLVVRPAGGTGAARARRREGSARSEQSRFEEEAMDFHQRVREAYRSLAATYPQRIRVVDAAGSVVQVHERVLTVLKKTFPSLKIE